MILFHAKRDGTVTTTPNFVPRGSSMQDLVVVSEFDYAYCAIKLYPASGEYIEDVPCTPILQKDYSTIFTAALPPKATVVAGSVDYQLIFTAADGTTHATLAGSFTVPRGVPVSTPGSVEELSVKTVGDLYAIMANTYGLFVGHERDIYQSLTDIAALKKTVSSAGYVTIPVTEWEDGSPTIALFNLDGFGKGMSALLIPADSNTQTAAREARLSAFPDIFRIDDDTQTVEIIRANADKAPEIPLRFVYLILKTDAAVAPSVAIIGVDAYGEGGGGTASGVDEKAVKALIDKEVPEWARSKQKPTYTPEEIKARPATWMPTADEVGARPSTWIPTAEEVGARPNTWTPTAADVGADSEGTAADEVKDHNKDGGSHVDIRLDVTTLRTMIETVIGTDTGKSMRAVAALVVAEVVGNASDSFDTLEEIAAWIEAHPNDVAAMVKRITDLEAAMGGKVSKTDIINTLDSTALDKPLSAAMGKQLAGAIGQINETLAGKTNAKQVSDAITAALKDYLTTAKAAELYQPKGDYLTPDTGDKRYAKPSDIPTVPTKLPNPNALTINGQTYDGSKAVSMTIEGGGSDADLAEEVARMKEQQPNLFVDAVQTGNLIDISMMHDGGRVDGYGNISSGASFSYSDFVDISKAVGTHLAVYVMHKNFVGQTSPAQYLNYAQIVYRMCFYDADKVKISYYETGGGKIADGSSVNETLRAKAILAIPANAVYVRVSYTSALTTSSINKYMVVRGDEADLNPLPPYSEYEPVREAVVVPEDLNEQLGKVRSAGRDQHQDNAVLTVTKLNNSATFSENGITFVGDELWVMKDDASYTNGTRIHRYHVDDETFTYLGYIDGDFGHLNTMDYCKANDCFIFGNGGNDQSTEGNYFVVVKHPLTIPYNTTTTIAELVAAGQAIKYDLDSTIGSIGYKVQALWGDANLGGNNRVILLANDTRSIREVLLSKTNGEFNGGLTVLRSFTFENDDSFGIQDADIWGDTLYIGGQGTVGNPGRYLICKVSLTDPSKREIIARDFYMDDGTALTGCVQGVYVDHDYIWIATNAPSTQSPQVAITKYRR
jgi:hypothetical protein